MVEKRAGSWVKYMAVGTTVATSLAVLVGGGYLLGSFLDNRLNTDPLLKVVFMILGVILGFTYVMVTLNKLGKSTDEQ